jgi:hypothetical protein
MSADNSSSRIKVRNVVLDSGPIIKGHALNMHLIAEVRKRKAQRVWFAYAK